MEHPRVTARETFSLFLEGAGPGDRAKRAREQAGEAAFEAARAAWSGKLLGPSVTAAAVEAALGPPDRREGSTLGYTLPGRPDHLYVFDFDPRRGVLLESGYRPTWLQREAPEPPRGPADHAAYRARLAAIGATASELRRWLGEPDGEDGWWPLSTFHYADGLSIELRHGMVE